MTDKKTVIIGYRPSPLHGVWRILTTLYPSLPDTGFLYSCNPLALSDFVQDCTQHSISMSLTGGIATPSSGWENASLRNNASAWLRQGSFILYRSDVKDGAMGYYLGWFELPGIMDSDDLQKAQVDLPPDFTSIQKSHSIHIYSTRIPNQLLLWYNENYSKEFQVVHRDIPYMCKLQSPVCGMCYGIHRECPLSQFMESSPVVQNSHKRSLPADGSFSERSSVAKQPHLDSSLRDTLLSRQTLVKNVVSRVRKDHFILVSYDFTNHENL